VPLVIHEQNSLPGLTNRWLAHIATRVLEAFPGSFPEGRARACGNPVRDEIAAVAEPDARLAGRSGPVRLLVLGGSQGAQALNTAVPAGLSRIPAALRPEVRHQAGRNKREPTEATYAAAGVQARVDEFVHDMAEAYAWADLAICRAGALTVSELAAVGLGALLVPYPHAVDDHQTHNAQHLVRAGAAEMLAQPQLTPQTLVDRLMPLLADRASLLGMARAARRLARPDAAEVVAQVCREVSR
jgi:UDP-N-acetylglucosamine--N-acetylmuramyl-(pentapeptide) pyrophosphoryl-undecaprenol N-acetylglucosamine transferase